MRELLFRGKPINDNKFVYGHLLRLYDGFFIISTNSNGDSALFSETYKVSEDTIGQYIGLSDKNNIKIFEGDFVMYYNYIFRVIYNEDLARFALHGTEGITPPNLTSSAVQHMTIINKKNLL